MFDDGIQFDTSGPLRLEFRYDGYYIVGEGTLEWVAGLRERERALIELSKRKENSP
jgi:hypothetical protein